MNMTFLLSVRVTTEHISQVTQCNGSRDSELPRTLRQDDSRFTASSHATEITRRRQPTATFSCDSLYLAFSSDDSHSLKDYRNMAPHQPAWTQAILQGLDTPTWSWLSSLSHLVEDYFGLQFSRFFFCTGWGAHIDGATVQGGWSEADRTLHISCLKMKAMSQTFKAWSYQLHGQHLYTEAGWNE